MSTFGMKKYANLGIFTCANLRQPDFTFTQVGVNSIIQDSFLQVTLTSYGTLALI